MATFQDPIFKGATRPPMILGVPATALFILTIITLVPIVLFAFYYAVILWIIMYFIMKELAKNDDQAFRVLGLWFMHLFRTIKSRFIWRGGMSYGDDHYYDPQRMKTKIKER